MERDPCEFHRHERESRADADDLMVFVGHRAPSSRKRRKCRFPSSCLNGYWPVTQSASKSCDKRVHNHDFVLLITAIWI